MKTRNLTHTSISLTLIIISFMLFRGSTNIFNAVIIPLIFYLNYNKFDFKYYVTLVLLSFIIALLFFFQQLFFIFLYALMAVFIKYLFQYNYPKLIKIIILGLAFGIGFYTTLTLTDTILGTALRDVLASVAAGNIFFLVLLYTVTSVFVSMSLLIIIPQIEKQLQSNITDF